MTLIFADVSKYQGSIDWAKYRAGGYRAAVARASISLTTDPYFAANLRGMRANGILPGAYHYLWPKSGGKAQADFFLKQLGGNPQGILTMLDVEQTIEKSADGTILVPTLSPQTMYDFAAEWKAITGGHPLMMYAPRWFWERLDFGNPKASQIGPLVSSRYVSGSGDPEALYAKVPSYWWTADWGGWTKVTQLQFSSHATFPGMTGNIDANAFQGSLSDLAFWAGILPESDMEEPVGLNPRLDVTNDANPYPELGRATIAGAGHDLISVKTGQALVSNVPDGKDLGIVQKGVIVDAVSGMFAAGEPAVFYNVNGQLCASPMRDVTFTPLSDPTPFSAADVKAATDPLKATVADLTTKLTTAEAAISTAAADERKRIAQAEAARIDAI
jgi:GH25 family lysozyme M1 (1,4-beta-N-acetylmuramidase)